MVILLTGVNGFFGNIIFNQISKDNKVLGLSRSGTDYNFSLDKKIPIFCLHFELVIHASGKAHSVHNDFDLNQEFYNVNVIGTQNLLDGLAKSSIPKYFVFISSVAVYGIDSGIAIRETTPLAATDPYGKSKIEAEVIVMNWCKQHNVVCTILRLPLILGPNPPGNLGALIKAIKRGYYFNIAGGRSKKSMVFGEDIAKAIIPVAKIGGIYNLTDGYNPSFVELSNLISIQLGKGKLKNMPFWIARIVAKFGDLFGNSALFNTKKFNKIVSDLTFDDTKARETFGWNPKSILESFKIKA
jgi:nucleoside-diphosphate-sugar epimerase